MFKKIGDQQEYIKNIANADEKEGLYQKFSENFKLNNNEREKLFANARKIRNDLFGNKLFVRSSVEYSNVCTNSCSYCGMAYGNKKLKRYTLTVDSVKRIIENIREIGIKQLHLVAGECKEIDLKNVCDIVEFATSYDINTTIVLGQKTKEEYQQLYEAGARRYIIKFETSNEKLFKKYKKSLLEERIEQLYILRNIGFKIGTGAIVDLPGSSLEDTINDLYLLNTIKPDMASASVFSPNSESILAGNRPGDVKKTLIFIAMMRMMLKENPPTISCSSSYGENGLYNGLMAGANVISYHATPDEFIDGFSSYRAKDRIKNRMDDIEKLAYRCGMVIDKYE